MRLALYYPWIHLTSGAERVIGELVRRSDHEYTVFTNRFDRETTFPDLGNLPVEELQRVGVKRNLWTTALNSWKLLRQKLPLEGFDGLVVLCEGLGDLVLLRNSGLPATCLCLTPLRACFDPVYRQHAFGQRSRLGRMALAAGTGAFEIVDRLLWKRYRKIVCISGEVRNRVLTAKLATAGDIEIAYPGVGLTAAGPVQPSERFFLLPGRIMWTKNHTLAIQAFHRMKQQHPELAHFRLVIAGMVDHKSQEYFQSLREQAAGDESIEFRASPSDSELADLYGRCFAVLFTPFNEDWGIVPLEAMAFSKPVVAVNRGGPRETVVHEVNGLLSEPSIEDFSTQMIRLAQQPEWAAGLGQAGSERWRKFSWEAFVSQVDRTVEVCVSSENATRKPERCLADPQFQPKPGARE